MKMTQSEILKKRRASQIAIWIAIVSMIIFAVLPKPVCWFALGIYFVSGVFSLLIHAQLSGRARRF